MREKSFDQLPVLSASRKLIGLITLGNCLSWMSQGRARADSPVKHVMFSFRKISEIVTDARDLERLVKPPPALDPSSSSSPPTAKKNPPGGRRRRMAFLEITLDTPLQALSRFFEWNSAAVVTERDELGELRPVAVVTKVDLLTWLVRLERGKT